MPRPRMRLAGILFTLAGITCSAVQPPTVEAPPPPPTTTPSVVPTAVAAWNQDLSFSGDLSGKMSLVTPGDAALRSECTGHNSRAAGAWASSLFGPVGADVYGLVVTVSQYRGPGTYVAPQASAQVHTPDNSAVWQTSDSDPATFTVDPDEESGSLDATLTNLASNKTKLQVRGRWSCRT